MIGIVCYPNRNQHNFPNFDLQHTGYPMNIYFVQSSHLIGCGYDLAIFLNSDLSLTKKGPFVRLQATNMEYNTLHDISCLFKLSIFTSLFVNENSRTALSICVICLLYNIVTMVIRKKIMEAK